MLVAIYSHSAAVHIALESVVIAAGHRVAKGDQSADLALVDALHPSNTQPDGGVPALWLTSAATKPHHLSCPLHPSALIQRLATYTPLPSPQQLAHAWRLNLQARALEHPDQPRVSLTEKECLLLSCLLKTPDLAIHRDALLEAVWGMDGDVETHTLETHIYRLRSKLEALTPIPGNILNDSKSYKISVGV